MMHVSSWKPSRISGLALWLDASMGVTTVDGRCSSWADQSGNNRHCSQGAAICRPLLVADGRNGRPVLRFDGDDQRLTYNSGWDAKSGTTMFVVSKSTSASDNRFVFTGLNTSGFPSFGLQTYNLKQIVYASASANTPARFTKLAPSFDIVVTVFSGALAGWARLACYNNGSIQTFTEGTLPGTTIGAVASLWVGGHLASYMHRGDIATIIVYDYALSIAQRQQVERYLAARYGITLV